MVAGKRWNDCGGGEVVYGNKRSSFFGHGGISGKFYVSVCISGAHTRVCEKSEVSMFKVG